MGWCLFIRGLKPAGAGARDRSFHFKGARVLVVGGAGFVGSNLVEKLLVADPVEVLIIDNMLSADRVNLPATRSALYRRFHC